MIDEDSAEIPDDWRSAVRPRRGGITAWWDPVSDQDRLDLEAQRVRRTGDFKAILDDPTSDPRVVGAARSGELSVEAEGARLAIDYAMFGWSSGTVLADLYVQRLGLALAAATLVESAAVSVPAMWVHGDRLWSTALSRHTQATDVDPASRSPHSHSWSSAPVPEHLRRLLAAADPVTYQATVELLTPFRHGLYGQRMLTSFLVPERRDWVAADFADVPNGYRGPRNLLFYSAYDADQIRGWRPTSLGECVTAWDGLGDQAVPLLKHWFLTNHEKEITSATLDVLSRIPSDDAFNTLMRLVELDDVPAALAAATDRYPQRALRLFAPRRTDPLVAVLLARHVNSHPHLPGAAELAKRAFPGAPAEQVPPLLSAPAWTRPRPRRSAVTVPEISPSIHWLDEEREEWSWDPWGAHRDTDWDAFLREKGATARFFVGGPEHLVRPMLATWPAETTWFYLENPRVVVAKYELDALAPILRLARRKPVVGARLLLPYLSAEIAQLMATWLAGSRQYRPIAQQWFDRHGVAGTALVIPTALGGPPAESRVAASALARLDPEVVRAAGLALGVATEVESLLARDPLDLIPGKVPTVPTWLDLDSLPQVLLRDGTHALPASAVEALCRTMAMSELDNPYEGLRLIADECDPASLGAFVWSLYCAWQIAGRPSKDVWALNALAYFGDDHVADLLAPLVRRWPSDGAAARAKRGADILAAMNSDRALQHLGAIARNAKSVPLRKHAAEALDRAALDRGMLPEQLDDLLAPDLGLGGDPVSYRGIDYVVELADPLGLVLHAPDGAVTTTLPLDREPDEKAAVQTWNRRRKKAKTDIADQVRRLEEAMIVQRRWRGDEFVESVVGHPLLSQLARRLIWNADGQGAVIDALGDLVDPDGGLLPPIDWVQVAHPATTDLARWRPWIAQTRIVQPFAQIERDTFDGDPSTHWNRTVTAASLYGLIRRGWHWGPTGRASRRSQIIRPLGAPAHVVLTFSPGLSAAQDARHEPDQTIDALTLESPENPDLGVFADLHRVTRSELIRDLECLT